MEYKTRDLKNCVLDFIPDDLEPILVRASKTYLRYLCANVDAVSKNLWFLNFSLTTCIYCPAHILNKDLHDLGCSRQISSAIRSVIAALQTLFLITNHMAKLNHLLNIQDFPMDIRLQINDYY